MPQSTLGLDVAALNMVVALLCGALIGSERQVRQRMAGLRTNALVALGSAGFVVFSMLYTEELSPTRVGAQVVSGIGFLGAGIIFRHGFTIHGLNTAATLWCSAAVGVLAGAGAHLMALVMTGLLIFVNLGLRPLVKFIKRKTKAGVPLTTEYEVSARCDTSYVTELRALMSTLFTNAGITPRAFDTSKAEESEVRMSAVIAVSDSVDLPKVIAPLLLDPRVNSVRWDETDEE